MWAVLHKRKLSSSQIILFGFAGVILVGTLLLLLPFATNSGQSASFWDALFTSTSAVCSKRQQKQQCSHKDHPGKAKEDDLG